MSDQQKPTPPAAGTSRRGSSTDADPTPPVDQAPEAPAVAEEKSDGGVELYRGEGKARETVTAFKPSTITRLKSEGWMPVEDEDA